MPNAGGQPTLSATCIGLLRSTSRTVHAKCRRAALAVAVGSIVRSKGGIALQSTLNLTAGTLLAAAQVCPGPAQLWLLHGMWLVVNSAGPAFLPHVSVGPCHLTLKHPPLRYI